MNLKRQFAVVKMGDFVRFPPSKIHDSYEEACEEAERLTRKERTSFYVWELVSAVCPEAITVKWYHAPQKSMAEIHPELKEISDTIEEFFGKKCPKPPQDHHNNPCNEDP